jgi:hypothetical protein
MTRHPVNRALFNKAYEQRGIVLRRLSCKLVRGLITNAQYNARVQRINIWTMRQWDRGIK